MFLALSERIFCQVLWDGRRSQEIYLVKLNSKEFTISCERFNYHFVKKKKSVCQKHHHYNKVYLSCNFNSRHIIEILSANNFTIIKRCMINTNYRIKPLFLVKLCCFQKIIQIIDLFLRRKIINVLIIILKSNVLLQQNFHFLWYKQKISMLTITVACCHR